MSTTVVRGERATTAHEPATPHLPQPVTRRRSGVPVAKLWLILSDTLLVVAAVVGAYGLSKVVLESDQPFNGYGPATAVCVGAILVALGQQRAYRARYLTMRREEYSRVIRAVALGLSLTIVLGFIFGFEVPQWMLLVLGTGSLLLLIGREVARRIFHRLRLDRRLVRRGVVVGDNHEADELCAMLAGSAELGYEIVGRVPLSEEGRRLSWSSVLADVQQTALDAGAGTVIVAASATDLETTGRLVRRLTDAGLHVEMGVPLLDIEVTRLRLRPLGRFPVFYVEPVERDGWRASAKRAFDVVVAGLSLLAALPVLAVLALLIKLDSKGPVLFRQIRVGRDGEEFPVLKLRTMSVDAEQRLDEVRHLNEADGPTFKIRNDPRVTRVGRYLRKFSLDEVPQLWNVVRGEMSLVGPRPALTSELSGWSADLYERLRVRPGITGMWQVNGRSDVSGDDYLRLDLYYVDNWSFFMDLVLLVKTVPVVLFGRGGY
jgi:exopolysaccharide biosynthesis polyprenyl glycosylphosphotransferase